MSRAFRRKLHAVFGIAVCASMGFGVAQVKASPAEAAESRLTCPNGYVECQCGEGTYCGFRVCRLCGSGPVGYAG